MANGRTRFTPLRESTEYPVSAGWDHVVERHFLTEPIGTGAGRSFFSVSQGRLKEILQSKKVVSSSVIPIKGGQFVRTVNVGEIIGISSKNEGARQTSWLQVITDAAGNLITTYPVRR